MLIVRKKIAQTHTRALVITTKPHMCVLTIHFLYFFSWVRLIVDLPAKVYQYVCVYMNIRCLLKQIFQPHACGLLFTKIKPACLCLEYSLLLSQCTGRLIHQYQPVCSNQRTCIWNIQLYSLSLSFTVCILDCLSTDN